MKTTPTHSDFTPPIEAPNKIRQEMSKSQYRRRDIAFTLFYPDLDQTFQAIHPNSDKGYTQITPASESESDQRILDPERENAGREFPQQEDHDDSNPTRYAPEEGNDLNDEDGSIIQEPTRELDDPYLPGHADRENIPPIKKEFLDSDPS